MSEVQDSNQIIVEYKTFVNNPVQSQDISACVTGKTCLFNTGVQLTASFTNISVRHPTCNDLKICFYLRPNSYENAESGSVFLVREVRELRGDRQWTLGLHRVINDKNVANNFRGHTPRLRILLSENSNVNTGADGK
ncbi:hypothetical protein J6590_069100 [Homalodisca vitripennis]|nr:hypothetical protein J6590_069100 [Homalodisca vitripennis]